MNLTQKLALIQRNQSMIDQLTSNNTALMNGVIMENTLSNLASVPGLPPQLAAMIRQVMNGEEPVIINVPSRSPGRPRLLSASVESHIDNGQPAKRKYTKKKRPYKRSEPVQPLETSPEPVAKTTRQKPYGFYDDLIINFAKKHNGRLSLKKFREQSIGKKGVPDTFFKTTMYTKVTSMTQGEKPTLKKVDAGEYDLVRQTR